MHFGQWFQFNILHRGPTKRVSELGLKGEETSFSLSTIEKQKSKVKCSVVTLVVHNLQEDEFIDLPSVFSTLA